MKNVRVRERVPTRRRPRLHGLLVPVAIVGVLAGTWGCGHETPVDPPPPPPPPRDTSAPLVRIMYPPPDSSTLYDRDSNGLMDLEVAWTDSGGRVNPASVRVTCAPDCLPGLPPDTNLAADWRVVRLDTAGLVVEETVPLLLREGARVLSVTVADKAGNVSRRSDVAVSLPPGSYHRSISLTGRPTCQPERGVSLVLSPDGTKGFAPYHFCVAVFDPDGVLPTHFIDPVGNIGWAATIAVDPATGLAYIGGGGTETGGFTILDTRTEQVVGGRSVGQGIAGVAVDGDRVYAGEACTDGRIYVYDKRTLAEVGQIVVNAVWIDSSCPHAATFAFSPDHRTGWAPVRGNGIVEFDTGSLQLVRWIVLNPSPPYNDARSVVHVGDRWLYVARVGQGIDEWDTSPLRLTQHFPEPPMFKVLALAPDGRTLAVSAGTGSGNLGDLRYAPRLYDVPGLTLRHVFATRRDHISDDLVWHPDGKRLYLMVEYQVEVYLVRPR
jgi:hypothetical protein